MKNLKNFLLLTLISLIISITVNLTYINIGIKNNSTEGFLYPNASSDTLFEENDLDDNFQWVRRAYENNSIFRLSANIFEIERKNSNHFQSSRGLSYYLTGLSLSLFEESINAVIFSKIFFLTISVLLFFKIINFYHEEISNKVLIVCLSLIFAAKLFGGVLNPFHYIEYFFQIKEFFIARKIDRIPNILVINIFVLVNFLLIKRYFETKKILFFSFCLFFLGISGFVTPIIFMVYTIMIFIIELHTFVKIKKHKVFLLKTLLLSVIFFPIMYFHIINLNSINDDSLNSPQWTGNYLYDLEIFIGPLLLIFIFFYKKIKEFYFEIIYFTAQVFLYVPSFFYDVYLASKINQNFVYLNAVISFSLLLKFFYLKKKINIKHLLTLTILCFSYLFIQHGINIKILLILIFIPIYLIINYYRKKSLTHFILGLSSFVLLFNLSYNHYLKNAKVLSNISQQDMSQKKLIQFLNKKKHKNTYLSLDFGILKNISIHTDQNVYFINITNTNLTEKILTERFYDIIYLYGFDVSDLQVFFENVDLDYQEKIKKITLTNLYHMQIHHKQRIFKKLLEGYKNYLSSNNQKLIKYFDKCIIYSDNLNYVKNNSFIFNVSKSKPIYNYSNYKIYNCKLNNKFL